MYLSKFEVIFQKMIKEVDIDLEGNSFTVIFGTCASGKTLLSDQLVFEYVDSGLDVLYITDSSMSSVVRRFREFGYHKNMLKNSKKGKLILKDANYMYDYDWVEKAIRSSKAKVVIIDVNYCEIYRTNDMPKTLITEKFVKSKMHGLPIYKINKIISNDLRTLCNTLNIHIVFNKQSHRTYATKDVLAGELNFSVNADLIFHCEKNQKSGRFSKVRDKAVLSKNTSQIDITVLKNRWRWGGDSMKFKIDL
jgi:hypothetical protein